MFYVVLYGLIFRYTELPLTLDMTDGIDFAKMLESVRKKCEVSLLLIIIIRYIISQEDKTYFTRNYSSSNIPKDSACASITFSICPLSMGKL